jgi:predicted nucleic acid-binding protein
LAGRVGTRSGIEILRPGKRRGELLAAVEKMFAEEFQDRVLPFDDAASPFAKTRAARDAADVPISRLDAMIAAIARSRGAVATRNTRDLERYGIQLINP